MGAQVWKLVIIIIIFCGLEQSMRPMPTINSVSYFDWLLYYALTCKQGS